MSFIQPHAARPRAKLTARKMIISARYMNVARHSNKWSLLRRLTSSSGNPELEMMYANQAAVRKQRNAEADTVHATKHKSDDTLTYGASHMRGLRPTMEDADSCALSLHQSPRHALFGVFDGHGGSGAARFAADAIAVELGTKLAANDGDDVTDPEQVSLLHTFAELDQTILANSDIHQSGACALVALLSRADADIDGSGGAGAGAGRPTTIHVANCGDSRAVLGRKAGLPALALSRDHKPNDDVERARVEAAGGEVVSVTYEQPGEERPVSVDRINGRLAVARALGNVRYKVSTGETEAIHSDSYV